MRQQGPSGLQRAPAARSGLQNMYGRLALLLLCICACIALCTPQAVSLPGSNSAALVSTTAHEQERGPSPRGFQAALAARRERRLQRQLEKLDRHRSSAVPQTSTGFSLKDTAASDETYEEQEDIQQQAPGPQARKIVPLVALAAAAFAAGLLMGYELGRSRGAAICETPDQPIPALRNTSTGALREAAAQAFSSSPEPLSGQAISAASEKQALRMRARSTAAAIELSSETDPKLFASAAGLQSAQKPEPSEQAEQPEASSEPDGLPLGSTEEEGHSRKNLNSQPVSDPAHASLGDSSLCLEAKVGGSPRVESQGSPAVAMHSSDGAAQAGHVSKHDGSESVPDSTLHSSLAREQRLREPTARSSAASVSAEAALEHICSSDQQASSSSAQQRSAEPPGGSSPALGSAEAVQEHIHSSIEQQAGSGGAQQLMSTSKAPDMLQSMQWVASSASDRASRHEPEQWDRATAFWAAFTSKLDIDTRDLTSGERIQLAGVLLQAWTAFQQQSHHQQSSQLQEEANRHRAAAAAAVQDVSAVKRARFQASLDAQQLARFQSALGDGLLFGIVVMLAAAGACAYQGGVAGLLFGHCPAMSDVGTLSLFRPWAALDALKVLGCWGAGVSDVLLATAAMLLTGRYLASSGALVGAHGAPLRQVALSLGALCGGAGYFVARRLHGNATRWLLWWEVWVALHLIVAWFMPGILKTLASPKRLPVPAQGVAQDAGRSQLQRLLSSAALPAYHVLMALVLPAATGVAAFGGAAQLVHVYDFWR